MAELLMKSANVPKLSRAKVRSISAEGGWVRSTGRCYVSKLGAVTLPASRILPPVTSLNSAKTLELLLFHKCPSNFVLI